MVNTLRQTNGLLEYESDKNTFEENVNNLAIDVNKFIIVGHCHYSKITDKYRLMNSFGYSDNFDYIMLDKILVISDCHFGMNDDGISNDRTKKRLLEVIEKEKPIEIIFNGDTVDLLLSDDFGASNYFSNLVRDLGLPCKCIKGNHDKTLDRYIRDNKLINFIDHWENDKYYIIHGNHQDPLWTKWYYRLWEIIGTPFDKLNFWFKYYGEKALEKLFK